MEKDEQDKVDDGVFVGHVKIERLEDNDTIKNLLSSKRTWKIEPWPEPEVLIHVEVGGGVDIEIICMGLEVHEYRADA